MTFDTTIKPGTKEEKYDVMKQQLIKRGKWSIEEDIKLRKALDMPESKVEVTTEDPPIKKVKSKKK